MHIAEHLAVWAYWLNNWVWCNNGPEIQNSGFTHELSTSWWWWAYPCQDIADSTWLMQTEWLQVAD